MNDHPASAQAELPAAVSDHPEGRHWPRLRWLIAAGVILVAAAAIAVVATGAFGKSKPVASSNPDPTALATVTKQSLSSQTQVNASLGYAGNYTVVVPSVGGTQPSAASGGATSGGAASADIFTALPSIGRVVGHGQSIYSINGTPTVLLYGSTPAYRSLSEDMSGSDVQQLNSNLVALGYATTSTLDPNSTYFSAATVDALEKLQAHLGVSQTGSLSLGQFVFLPSAARVTTVSAVLGAPAEPGSLVLQATSTTRAVIVQLDPTQQSEVKVGDQVTITLPDNSTTPGVVTSVGTVATSPSTGAGSGSSPPTIEVDVKPSDPSATGSLDQAPVNVTITTATVNDALVVPIDALLARASGGYAVEIPGAGNVRHLVPVSLGLFDDADGLVQVSGPGLSAGQQVVVPRI